MSRHHAFVIVLVFAGLTVGVFYCAWFFSLSHLTKPPTADDWKNFYSIAGVGIAAVSGVMGAWVSFRNLSAQAKTSADLERVKKVLEKSVPAYGSLFASASSYYRALAPLETGGFNPDMLEAAEARMKEAEGEIVFVNDEYIAHWNSFWQNARFVKEKANRDAHTAEDRKRLWSERSKTLAQDITEMKKMAQTLLGR